MYFRAAVSNMNGLRLVGTCFLLSDYFGGCAGQFNWNLSEKGTEHYKGALYCPTKSPIIPHQHPGIPCKAHTSFTLFDSYDENYAAEAYTKTLASTVCFVSFVCHVTCI
jgi:hypothetical protein